MKLSFRDCTLAKLDNLLGLKEVKKMPVLTEWLASKAEISDFEHQTIENLQRKLIDYVNDWNENELALRFIGPFLELVDYTDEKFTLFSQRTLEAKIGNIELSGKPDGIIASGKRLPQQPYFCLHEYKADIGSLWFWKVKNIVSVWVI